MLYAVDDLAVRTRLARLIADRDLMGQAAYDAIAKESVKDRHGGRPVKAPALLALIRAARIWKRAKEAGAFAEASLEGFDPATRKAVREEGRTLAAAILELVKDV